MSESNYRFYVFNSNRLEGLCDLMQKIIYSEKLRLENPLKNEQIVVMNRGMQTYLSQTVADLGGICAGIEFSQPWGFIWSVMRLLHPKAGRENLYSHSHLTWSMFSTRNTWKDSAILRKLHSYCVKENDPKEEIDDEKAFELCSHIADVFDQYQMYRGDYIKAWNSLAVGEEDFLAFEGEKQTVTPAMESYFKAMRADDDRKRRIFAENLWQAVLWHRLKDNLKRPAGADGDGRINPDTALTFKDRADILSYITDELENGNGEADFSKLPGRVFIFDVIALPPAVLEFFKALSKHTAVFYMLLNPCRDYWGDITSDQKQNFDRFKALVRNRRDKNAASEFAGFSPVPQVRPARSDDELYSADDYDKNGVRMSGNQLLLSLGAQERELITRMLSWTPGCDMIDVFYEPENGPQTVLHGLQHSLLYLDGPKAPLVIAPEDNSVQVRVCHTRLREIEVLHDAVLTLFKDNKKKKNKCLPRDILVMVPDIEAYTPYIEAVFGAADRGSPNYISYQVSDRVSADESEIAGAVLRLLSLSAGPLTASDVLSLLEVPALAARFNISRDDVAVISQWCAGAGIHFGLEKDGESAGVKLPWTFEEGLSRMLMGYMCGGGSESPYYTEIDGGDDGKLLGNFADFVQKLIDLRRKFTPFYVPKDGNWTNDLEENVLKRFFVRDKDSRQELNAIKNVVRTMQNSVKALQGDDAEKHNLRITLPVFAALLSRRLMAGQNQIPYLRGELNFCSMVPMRAVPFKHIFMLGLNEKDFPRRDTYPGFNLMSVQSLRRPGDRSGVGDDRLLFLETLLAARESIYFSYVGQNPVNQKVMNPSIVLSELLDSLEDLFTLPEGVEGTVRGRLTHYEHLSAYSPLNFTEQGGDGKMRLPPSFDKKSQIGEIAPTDQPRYLGYDPAFGGVIEGTEIEVDGNTLARALTDPCKFFAQHSLGLNFDGYDDEEVQDLESFELGKLPEGKLCLELAALLDENAVNEGFSLREKRGVMPYGVFEERTRAGVSAIIRNYAKSRETLPKDGSAAQGIFTHTFAVACDDGVTRNFKFNMNYSVPKTVFYPYSDKIFKASPLISVLINVLSAAADGVTAPESHVIVSDGRITTVCCPLKPDEATERLMECLSWYQRFLLEPIPVNREMLETDSYDGRTDVLGKINKQTNPTKKNEKEGCYRYDKASLHFFGSKEMIADSVSFSEDKDGTLRYKGAVYDGVTLPDGRPDRAVAYGRFVSEKLYFMLENGDKHNA